MFGVNDMILRNVALDSYSDGGVRKFLNPSRLLVLWDIICEENDRELHLVSPTSRSVWVDFRDSVNKKLAAASTDKEKIAALSDLASIVSHGEVTDGSFDGFGGSWCGKKLFHADLSDVDGYVDPIDVGDSYEGVSSWCDAT